MNVEITTNVGNKATQLLEHFVMKQCRSSDNSRCTTEALGCRDKCLGMGLGMVNGGDKFVGYHKQSLPEKIPPVPFPKFARAPEQARLLRVPPQLGEIHWLGRALTNHKSLHIE